MVAMLEMERYQERGELQRRVRVPSLSPFTTPNMMSIKLTDKTIGKKKITDELDVA